MTYTLVNLVFLAVAVGLLVAAIRVSRTSFRADTSGTAGVSGVALLVTAVLLVVLTLVFNNLMIAAGFVDYGHAQTSGIRIGVMPVEDLAYTVFAVLALPALWTVLGNRSAALSGTPAPERRESGAPRRRSSTPEAPRAAGDHDA
ncbi:lycopene cyclase domain-containing protein [Brevibacterium samyangense]|uniref:Lycopene cyclase domain-containing protein n=1 Tax=Brevibacterium samyangense TaxID=366888 RepID=A0ABP5EYF9_9MICO